MGLDKLLWLSCFLVILNRASATTICSVDDISGCTYTVICIFHPGSASNPLCQGEPNVTFIISNSGTELLTTAFFGATNFDNRVRFIKASRNVWPILSKHSFRYYNKCTYMDLSGNKIREIQDETFKTLVSLQHLNLSNNELDHLELGSFKISDSKVGNLEVLDLSYNALTDLTDEVLLELPSLYTLYLNGNRLIKLSDNCFGGLKFLNALYLQYNDLETLNITLVNLKSLTYLDLSYNHLKKLTGYETNRLQNLEVLNMSHNEIETVDGNCFIQSLKLRRIDLSFNVINSKIDNHMFGSSVELEFLDLYKNDIRVIEGDSFKNNNLTYLNLEKNNITGEITYNTFAGLKYITKLDLSQQNITILKNKSFIEMTNLTHLNLSTNHIKNIENLTFVNSSVLVLDLSFNDVSKLHFLNGCLVNLTDLYLNNNKITTIEENLFKKQNSIKKLDLSMNKITKIEVNALPLASLQYLNILDNQLTGDVDAKMFSPAKYLRFLDLSNYNLSKINYSAFIDMPVLARLNLSHNVIENIETDNFRNISNMYSLDLSYNKLEKLQFNNSLLTNLKSAYLNNNKLSNFSRIFQESCKLLYLDMSHNGVWDVSNANAEIFPELQVLHLSHNNINQFNNRNTNTLANLVDLRLSSNKIKNINLSFFKELLIVDLSNNNLAFINNTFLKNIDFLQSLDLSRNKLADLPPGTFQNMRNLKLLNLSSNYISKLRYGSLKGLHKTELLDLSNNKMESLDVHVFHECSELKTLIIDYNRIKTLDIEKLVLVTQRKLKTLSLGGNPISCQEIIRNATLKDLSYYGIRQIEITSIHKIYHEDNVHGIKCGDGNYETTVKVEAEERSGGSSFGVIAWCSVLTIVIIAVGVLVYIKLRKQSDVIAIYRDSRMQLRSSLELSGSEYQNDLLN
ncbi:Tartan/capricious-like protein [Operophtera brumata]|uniref:Tartan/capricious-like protein n=1 Tax=Operophtera brumata TaxID=104452 RepID=A0A0L7LHF2_OPEBR|nr:Tartan/capricious-like protein [Operophtera brumata]